MPQGNISQDATQIANNGNTGYSTSATQIKYRTINNGSPLTHDTVDANFEIFRNAINGLVSDISAINVDIDGVVDKDLTTDLSGATLSFTTNSGSRNYGIRKSGTNLYVNVPWVDTNTTYSAGNGISLSGTTFTVGAGGGLTQTSSGLAHADTSSLSSVNNSGRTYIQDITLDGYGHVTGINSATESYTYSLPTASSSTLGGIKVGSGLSISSGVLSANVQSIPTASSTVLGGIKVGSGLSISNGVLSAAGSSLTTDSVNSTHISDTDVIFKVEDDASTKLVEIGDASNYGTPANLPEFKVITSESYSEGSTGLHPAIHVDPNNTEYDGANRSYVGIRSLARPPKSMFRVNEEPRLNVWTKGGVFFWTGIGDGFTSVGLVNSNYRTGTDGITAISLQGHNYPLIQFALSKQATAEDIADSQVATTGLSAGDYITEVLNLPPSGTGTTNNGASPDKFGATNFGFTDGRQKLDLFDIGYQEFQCGVYWGWNGIAGTGANVAWYIHQGVMQTSGRLNKQPDLGNNTSSGRWNQLYATNTSISTSDVSLKQDIEPLDEAEKRVGVALKGLIKKYKWKKAVERKGDDARYHVGVIAQDVEQAFIDEGLDGFNYGILCRDIEWVNPDPQDETFEQDGKKIIKAVDRVSSVEKEGWTKQVTLSVRYEELLAFVISAL